MQTRTLIGAAPRIGPLVLRRFAVRPLVPRHLPARIRLAAFMAVVTALAALGAGAVATPSVNAAASPSFTAKGPVGWDTLRHLDAFDMLPVGVQTKQFSSFDRAQKNKDNNNCLRTIGSGGCVVAETTGAGEIDDIWFTDYVRTTVNGTTLMDWGNVTGMGSLVVVLDGKTVINHNLQDLVNGGLGAPFVYPLVANQYQSSGGVHIDVPMTYTSSMLVYTTATTSDADYYHVTYRSFADTAGVSTFNPADTASDVISMLKASGTADPKPAQTGAATTSAGFDLAAGASRTLATLSGPAEISALRLKLPQLAATPSQFDSADDGRAFGSGGSSTFTVAIDPSNQGVRLTRRLDETVANQVASVAVNGAVVGQWTALAASSGNYVDQALDLPASVTAGKSSITVKNTFVSSGLDFNEFHYWVDSLVGGAWKRTDAVDVGNAGDESAHSYAIVKQTWSGTRGLGTLRYAQNSTPQLTDDGRAFGSGGSSTFTVAIDPNNSGVVLTRRLDDSVANQVANVTVNGTSVGQWTALPNGFNNQFWDDQTLSIPASLTAGKSSITVKNSFVSSGLDFNEFHYWADSVVSGALVRTDSVDVGNAGSESAHGYAVVDQTWSGTRTYGYFPTAVVNSNAILADVRIRISFDGSQLVDAPLGEFFGSSQYDGNVRSLMTGMDPGVSGWLSAWWPMPYASGATVTLYNGGSVPLTGVTSQVTAAPCAVCGTQLANGTIGYFHTTSHSVSAVDQVVGKDYTILNASGHGKYVGVALGMTGPINRIYLEGNEHVYVDGSESPNPNGTGTEDYFDGGWYFTNGPFSLPFNGSPSHQAGTYGCLDGNDCTSTYRLTIQDAVPFSSGLTYDIEHGFNFNASDGGHGDDVAASYSSTAFWYGDATAASKTTDTLNVGDAASESAHGYTSSAPGNVGQTTATYEGNDGTPVPVTVVGRTTSAAVSFTLAVDPSNVGVTLRRTSNQTAGYQQAAVSVDGTGVGTWTEAFGNTYHRLLDDSFQLPSSVTAGKSQIAVTLTPASGSPPWAASRYQAVSMVAPFTDVTAPSAVSGVAVHATSAGSTLLSWTAASDNVAVDHYAVYAAQNAAPVVGAGTLVGTSGVPSFAHAGLAAGQSWHYVVVAVDAAGNAGAPSADAAVTVAAPTKMEAESLAGSVTGTAPAASQPNCCNIVWSNNAQLFIQPTAIGQYATVTFTAPAAGRYDVSAAQTVAGDYGVVTVAVDGTRLGGAFDGYAPSVQITDATEDYGAVQLAAGAHTLTIAVGGKDGWSGGLRAGVDYLVLSSSS